MAPFLRDVRSSLMYYTNSGRWDSSLQVPVQHGCVQDNCVFQFCHTRIAVPVDVVIGFDYTESITPTPKIQEVGGVISRGLASSNRCVGWRELRIAYGAGLDILYEGSGSDEDAA